LNVAKGDASALQYMSGRFTSPVLPGDEVSSSSDPAVRKDDKADDIGSDRTVGNFDVGFVGFKDWRYSSRFRTED
jgi:acyl dehydratase